jgi:DNA polymerase
MFIAEAPGENEMIIGKPLIGMAGQLFDKLLEAAGIDRAQCYIDNIVHCRPTEGNEGFKNRPPTDGEIQACRMHIWNVMQAISPKIIVTLGKVPTYTLLHSQLNKSFTLKSVVGNEFHVEYFDSVIMPAYHPSFILQRGKKHTEETIELFKKIKGMLPSDYHDNWANISPTERPFKGKKK